MIVKIEFYERKSEKVGGFMKKFPKSGISKDLFDNMYMELGISEEYLLISYGEVRFRLNNQTNLKNLKKMLSMNSYNDNDICAICSYLFDYISVRVYLDPIVKINEELKLVGGRLLQSEKLGDFELDGDGLFFSENFDEDNIGDEDFIKMYNEEVEAYKLFLEKLTRYLKLAVEDKYNLLYSLADIIINSATVMIEEINEIDR